MSNSNETPSSNSTATTVSFSPDHQPPLTSGDYTITVEQSVVDKLTNHPFSAIQVFSVLGPRFDLLPQDIYSVFPPNGSRGDYSNALPHIMFNRSTLPWERKSCQVTESGSAKNVSWLILLVFYEEEIKNNQVLPPEIVKVQEITQKESNFKWKSIPKLVSMGGIITDLNVWIPQFPVEKAQNETDKVAVIDVRVDLLRNILPSLNELKSLSHVRYKTKNQNNKQDNEQEEFSTIIANRIAKKDFGKESSTVVHLISIEDQYSEAGFSYPDLEKSEDTNNYIRFVSLKNWTFSCQDSKYQFQNILNNVNFNTLKLPATTSNDLEPYINKGYVPLTHYHRKGEKTMSWYHSPLLPIKNLQRLYISLLQSPPQNSDQLLCHQISNSGEVIFDTSYAVAWQLGRMLILQNKQIAIDYSNWKKSVIQDNHKKSQYKSTDSHLQIDDHLNNMDSPSLPVKIMDWFQNLAQLQGIPFNYLVPDSRMLPDESIRFFNVDPLWIDSILDGAISLNRISVNNASNDNNNSQFKFERHVEMSGFLLRSEVVAGWPGLIVEGKQNDQAISPLRLERLSPEVLLCLFESIISEVKIYLKNETVHFGVKSNEPNDPINFNTGTGIINILTTETSAQFASRRLQPNEGVQFSIPW